MSQWEWKILKYYYYSMLHNNCTCTSSSEAGVSLEYCRNWATYVIMDFSSGSLTSTSDTHTRNIYQYLLHLFCIFRPFYLDLGMSCNYHTPAGSSNRGIFNSLSAMWNASSRFCLLLLVLALDKLTTSGLSAQRIAKNTTPLLQLVLKSFTSRVQPALKETDRQRESYGLDSETDLNYKQKTEAS